MRILVLLLSVFITLHCQAQSKEAWFQYDETAETYYIDATNIHPAAFFQSFSLNSGIEIQFDTSLNNPIHFYSKQATQDQIIQFLEKEFSTLLTFKKNVDNIEILTSIAILPKGQFQSSNLALAVNPIEEAISLKRGDINKTARPVYITRLDHLENKVRENLERQAERTIKKQEQRLQRIEDAKQRKQERKQTQLAELEALKQTDPKLYAAKKAILFPKTNNKE